MYPPDPRMMAEEEKPSRVHWLALVIFAAGVLLLVIFAVIPGIRMRLHEVHLMQVKKGMSAEETEGIMGPGDREVEAYPRLERFWGKDVQLQVEPSDLQTVLTWRVSFLVKRFTWQVGLDAEGRAIAKTRFDE